MSYDYDALVKKIANLRHRATETGTAADDSVQEKDDNEQKHGTRTKSASQQQHLEVLQGAMDTFEELSGHCPMTPLLWIQYGDTVFDFCQALAQTSASTTTNTATSSLETQLQILQLGLQEFPGSLLLQFRYIGLLQRLQQSQPQETTVLPQPPEQDLKSVLEHAITAVGHGSHSSQGARIVHELYEPLALLYATSSSSSKLHSFLLDQATRPLPNEGLWSFYQQHVHNPLPEDAEQAIEHGRRLVAKTYHGALQLPQLEADIESQMHGQHLEPPWNLLDDNDNAFWKAVLMPSSTTTFGMGLGGLNVAQCFVTMATTLSRYKEQTKDDDVDDEQYEATRIRCQQMTRDIHELSVSVYERGVAECPTVEKVWTSYLDRLEALVQERQTLVQERSALLNKNSTEPAEGAESFLNGSVGSALLLSAPQRLLSVSRRACRNCPYSMELAQRQLHIQGLLASFNLLVLDPDKLLTEMVQPALDSRFLPADRAAATLYLTLLRVIQQRILALLVAHVPPSVVASFDVALNPNPSNQNKKQHSRLKECLSQPIPEDTWTEIQDLVQDFLEVTSTMDERLAKLKKSKVAATTRSLLQEQKALSLQHVLLPLLQWKPQSPDSTTHDDERHHNTLQSLQKAAKLQNPAHPDTQLTYIRYFLSDQTTPHQNPAEVALHLCHVRFLFQQAVTLAGGAATSLMFPRDYVTSLQALTHEWLQFEQRFGSPQSVQLAQTAIQRKLERAEQKVEDAGAHQPEPQQSENGTRKDARMPVNNPDPPPAEPTTAEQPTNTSTKTDVPEHPREQNDHRMEKNGAEADVSSSPKSKKHGGHMVKVGHMEYPAHPFTVRVFNLSERVQDMDLVDLFQNNANTACGKLVHARIMRDRATHGKSKGWGLVQFEEQESVEKALALHGAVGLHEQSVSIQRSHTPAVPSVVPPGMHRVKPQGEGRASKRNLKRKAQKLEEDSKDAQQQGPAKKVDQASQKAVPATTKTTNETQSQASVLSFVPRRLGKGHNPKTKVG